MTTAPNVQGLKAMLMVTKKLFKKMCLNLSLISKRLLDYVTSLVLYQADEGEYVDLGVQQNKVNGPEYSSVNIEIKQNFQKLAS